MSHPEEAGYQKIIDHSVTMLDQSDVRLSRIMARAIRILPLPPIVGTRPAMYLDNTQEIRSAWAFGQESDSGGIKLTQYAGFSLWLTEGKSDVIAAANIRIQESSSDSTKINKISVWMPQSSFAPELHEHTFGGDEDAVNALANIVEDMELGVMKYDESQAAQLHRSRAHILGLQGCADTTIHEALDEAYLQDIQHKYSYGLEL